MVAGVHRGLLLALVGCILGLVPVLPAQAQAPEPSGAANTLWLHFDAASPRNYWSSTSKDDPDHSGSGAGYNALGFVIGDEAGVAQWSMPLRPELTKPVALDPAGKVLSTIYIGGASNAGRVTVTSEVRIGSTVVATATSSAITYANAYTKVELSADPEVPALDPTVGPLTWVVLAEGAGSQILLAASGETWTSVALPLVGGGSDSDAVRYHDLNGTMARIAHNPTAAANATHVYNWTTNLTALTLAIAGDRSAGNATVQVVDGANATVFEGTFDGNATTKDVTGAAGNWTVRVVLQAFTGNLTIELGAPDPASASSSQSGSLTATGTGTQAGTGSSTVGNATDDDTGSEGAPGPATPLLLVALAALAVVARRRR